MAQVYEKLVGGAVNMTEDLVKDTVEMPTNIIKEAAGAGEKGVEDGLTMTEEMLEDTEKFVTTPFDDFLDNLTDCFGLLPA